MSQNQNITYGVYNNSTDLGCYPAKSILAAVRAGRKLLKDALGEGAVAIFVDGELVRCDHCNIFTGFSWRQS